MKQKRGWFCSGRMLSMRPVWRLSRQITLCPRCTRRSHRCEPMKPAPPVTRTERPFRSSGVCDVPRCRSRSLSNIVTSVGNQLLGNNLESGAAPALRHDLPVVALELTGSMVRCVVMHQPPPRRRRNVTPALLGQLGEELDDPMHIVDEQNLLAGRK